MNFMHTLLDYGKRFFELSVASAVKASDIYHSLLPKTPYTQHAIFPSSKPSASEKVNCTQKGTKQSYASCNASLYYDDDQPCYEPISGYQNGNFREGGIRMLRTKSGSCLLSSHARAPPAPCRKPSCGRCGSV